MPRPDRIVLCGKNGAGKTSIATEWARLTGGAPLSFADPIRIELARGLFAADLVPINTVDDYLSLMTDPETKDQFRGLLQEIGKYRTRQDPRYWVDRFDASYRALTYTNHPMSCGDCRLQNQHDLLRNWGFTFVLVDSTGNPYVRDQGDRADDETEQYWPTWEYDFVLDFQEGVEHQARRLIDEFGLGKTHK